LGRSPSQPVDPAGPGEGSGDRPAGGIAENSRPHIRHAAKKTAPEINRAAPAAAGRKAVLYATCFVNYNNPAIGEATRAVLARNGVETQIVYPRC